MSYGCRLGVLSHTAQEKDWIYKKSIISWCVGECLKLVSLMFKDKSQRKELNLIRAERCRAQTLTGGSKSKSKNKCSNYNVNDDNSDIGKYKNKTEEFLCGEMQRLDRERHELKLQYMKVYHAAIVSSSRTQDNDIYFMIFI